MTLSASQTDVINYLDSLIKLETPSYNIPESIEVAIDPEIVTPVEGNGTKETPLVLEVNENTTAQSIQEMLEAFKATTIRVKLLTTKSAVLTYGVELTMSEEVVYLTLQVKEGQTDVVDYLNE